MLTLTNICDTDTLPVASENTNHAYQCQIEFARRTLATYFREHFLSPASPDEEIPNVRDLYARRYLAYMKAVEMQGESLCPADIGGHLAALSGYSLHVVTGAMLFNRESLL